MTRGILVQAAMGPVFVVVIEVFFEHFPQVLFTEDDVMIKAIPANRADHPFHIPILPGAFIGSNDLLDAHVPDTLPEGVAVNGIPVLDQIFGRNVPGEGLPNLLQCPGGGGISGNVKVNDPPPVMTEDQQHIKDFEMDGGHGEEIDCTDGGEVISQKALPCLSGPTGSFGHEIRHRPFGDLKAELE